MAKFIFRFPFLFFVFSLFSVLYRCAMFCFWICNDCTIFEENTHKWKRKERQKKKMENRVNRLWWCCFSLNNKFTEVSEKIFSSSSSSSSCKSIDWKYTVHMWVWNGNRFYSGLKRLKPVHSFEALSFPHLCCFFFVLFSFAFYFPRVKVWLFVTSLARTELFVSIRFSQ